MIVPLEMHASGNIFGKICLKAVRDNFLPQYVVWDQETDGETLLGVISNRRGKFKLLGWQVDLPPPRSPNSVF